jgi:hypothetical protein
VKSPKIMPTQSRECPAIGLHAIANPWTSDPVGLRLDPEGLRCGRESTDLPEAARNLNDFWLRQSFGLQRKNKKKSTENPKAAAFRDACDRAL